MDALMIAKVKAELLVGIWIAFLAAVFFPKQQPGHAGAVKFFEISGQPWSELLVAMIFQIDGSLCGDGLVKAVIVQRQKFVNRKSASIELQAIVLNGIATDVYLPGNTSL
jgi:hypothetical protein